MKRPTLAEFLATPHERKSRCKTCLLEEWRVEIATFAERRSSGATSYSWSDVYKLHLRPNGYPFGYAALMQHARNCLGFDGDKR